MSRSPVAFGSYVITRRIARGGMAEIYRARARAAAGPGWVAIKMMRPSLDHEDLREQLFKREAKIAAALSHPNVVSLVEFGRELDRYFIAMEYVRGRDLSQLVRPPSEGGQLMPLEMGLLIGEAAARGLGHAHQKTDPVSGRPLGIVHRDISPGNIMISYDGAVKVLDFGVARMTESQGLRTQTGTLRGKFAYMSPEQTVGAAIDARSDVFSLGTVLYEMLTGTNPFRARTPIATLERVQRVRPVPPSRLVNSIPRDLDEVLAQCLAKDPRRRFKDAAELAEALGSFARRRPAPSPGELGRFMSDRFRWEKQEEERELKEEEQGVALIEVVDFALAPDDAGLDAPNVAVHDDEVASRAPEQIRSEPSASIEAEEAELGVFQSAEALTVAQPSPFRDLEDQRELSEPTKPKQEPKPKPKQEPQPAPAPPKHDTDGLLAAMKDQTSESRAVASRRSSGAPAPEPANPKPSWAYAALAILALAAALGVIFLPKLWAPARGRARPAPTEIAPITISVSQKPSPAEAPASAAAPPPSLAPEPSLAPSSPPPSPSVARVAPVELTAQASPAPPADASRDDDDDPREGPGRPRGPRRIKRAPPPPSPSVSAAAAPGFLNVGAKPWGEIEIDGKPWPYQTPQAGIELPPGRHVVRLSNRETGVSKVAVVHIKGGQYKTVNLDLRTQ